MAEFHYGGSAGNVVTLSSLNINPFFYLFIPKEILSVSWHVFGSLAICIFQNCERGQGRCMVVHYPAMALNDKWSHFQWTQKRKESFFMFSGFIVKYEL